MSRTKKKKTQVPAKDRLYSSLFGDVKAKPLYFGYDAKETLYLRGRDPLSGGTYLIDLSKIKKPILDELKETLDEPQKYKKQGETSGSTEEQGSSKHKKPGK